MFEFLKEKTKKGKFEEFLSKSAIDELANDEDFLLYMAILMKGIEDPADTVQFCMSVILAINTHLGVSQEDFKAICNILQETYAEHDDDVKLHQSMRKYNLV